ncbi:MAG: DUF3794 domain-containing protein, partial [Clostridiaceae bacterium]|nr:DUF3794 domain-containing protein [Clostridiaceae bacterium]
SKTINICNSCLRIKDIINIYTKVNIIKTKVIATPRGISYEGVFLTGSKILIIGVVEYSITYIDRVFCQTCCKKFTSGFSTSIVVPKGIHHSVIPEIHISIENTSITPIENNSIQIDSTLLISAI